MSWKKVKLGDILKRRRETIKIEPEEEYKLVTIRIHHKGVTQRCIMKGSEIKSPMSAVRAGDFILSGIDARNGAFGIVPDELDGAIVTNDFWCLDPDDTKIEKEFLLFLTSTDFFDYICKQSSDGMTQRIRLQKDKFYNYEIALPSTDEQKIILKRLKEQKANSEILNKELTHQLDLVKKLRQQFLQEAVQGKLIDNGEWTIENGETGAALLERIKTEKAKTGKKEKPLPPIKDDEIPFDIPDNWVWCRLGEMSVNCDGDRKPISQSERERKEKIYDYYGASGVIDKIDGFTHDGDYLLIGEDGANLVARSTPIAFLAKGKFWVNNHAHVIQTIDRITLDYICYYFNAIDLKPFITGGFQPKLSQGNLNIIPIPLPPLSIQAQIVTKVAGLMGLCDAIEAGIRESKGVNEALLQQVLREALAR